MCLVCASHDVYVCAYLLPRCTTCTMLVSTRRYLDSTRAQLGLMGATRE